MQNKGEQIGQLIEIEINHLKNAAKTESYEQLVSGAKQIIKKFSEKEVYDLLSKNIALFNLFCVQMFNLNEVNAIFPNHNEEIYQYLLSTLSNLYLMNHAETAIQEFDTYYYFNFPHIEILKAMSLATDIVYVGYYRFMRLLEDMAKAEPNRSINLCKQLMNDTKFVSDLNMDYLLNLLNNVFIDYPDCQNIILEIYTEKCIKNQNFLSINEFVPKAPSLFKAYLNESDSCNFVNSTSQRSKDKTLQLILNLFELCSNKINDNEQVAAKISGLKAHTSFTSILELAVKKEQWGLVELLLTYPHPEEDLEYLLHRNMEDWFIFKNTKKGQERHKCSELIKTKLGKDQDQKLLSLENHQLFSWDQCFTKLFHQIPEEKDKFPKDNDAAVRYAITSIYEFMLHPKKCLPYLQFLSEELELQWQKEYGAEFPKFNTDTINLWPHQGLLWPIPIEKSFQSIKKNNLLNNLMLTKFKQYGMGETQNKWTGFVPKKTSKMLLSNNAFFKENGRNIHGLTHGNVHNIQRVIMLYAMENGVIPLSYYQEDNTMVMIEPKEVFAALMRTDLSLKKASHTPLWNQVFDLGTQPTFTSPRFLHSMILTNEALKGTLQDYFRFGFCSQFNKMLDLFNESTGTEHNLSAVCNELKKINFSIFLNQFEELSKIEEEKASKNNLKLKTDGKSWAILSTNYKTLDKVRDYETEELTAAIRC